MVQNGVRALLLDTYDYKGDVWLCHSFKGKCHSLTAFVSTNFIRAFFFSLIAIFFFGYYKRLTDLVTLHIV